jgi:hypothetical protein
MRCRSRAVSTISSGEGASLSATRSPRLVSPSTPTGVSSETVSCAHRVSSLTRSTVTPSAAATWSGSGSVPSSRTSWRVTLRIRLTSSTRCTGRRTVRSCCAIARLIA